MLSNIAHSDLPYILLVILLLAGLTFMVLSDSYIRKVHRRVMLLIIVLCYSLIAQNYIETMLEAGTSRILERTLVSIYGYSVRPIIILLFFYIIRQNRRYIFAWVLVGINMAVHMTALFSHICFWIDAGNHYQGGPLSSFCLYVSLIFLAYYLYLIFHEFGHVRKREIAALIFNLFLIIAAIIMDGYVGHKKQPVTYLTIAIVISSVFAYIWLHQQFVREHENDLKAQQRIQIMMTQIQPHFLYNTLSTIQALCDEDSKKAAKITGRFAKYLRQNLDFLNQPVQIDFDRELEHTLIYAEIEMVRFPNIRLETDILDKDYTLPALTVQPMVENAIRHGVRICEQGVVRVSTRRLPDCHEIVIEDNGRGFDVKKLKEADETHIGIRNVRERIEQICGGTLEITSRQGEGTTVTIRIPVGGGGKNDGGLVMNVICVDDEELLAKRTAALCRELPWVDEAESFRKSKDALKWLDKNEAEIAILDIDMPDMSGIQLAAKIKMKHPDTKIIFLTGFPQYAVDSYKVRATGYLLKPVDEDELSKEVEYAIFGERKKQESHVVIQTFGGFDIFVDGELVSFKQKKCKELLAVLVDRRGTSVTRAQAFAILYENQLYDRPMQKQFDSIIRLMRGTLKEYGVEDIFEMKSGQMRICPEHVSCDLYRFFEGDVDAINAYGGEYMSCYSWASPMEGLITYKCGGG